MSRRPRIGQLGLCLVVAVAALGACQYQNDETELGRLDGDVRARAVYVEKSEVKVACEGEGLTQLCWPASFRHRAARLEVEGPHDFSVHLPGRLQPFDRLELAADDDGTRVAYRSTDAKGHAPWRLAFAGEEGRGYAVGSVASNEDGRPDWGSAPEFSEVAPRAFTYGRHKARAGLLSDIRTRYGTSGLEEFLITTADVGARGNNHVRRALDGAWGQALSELPRPSRDRVLQRLRHRFINGELGSNSTLRSLRYVELSDRNVLDRIERTLRRSDKFGRWRIAEAIMLRALARHRPHKAGRIACQRLQNESAAELIDGGNTPSDFLREAYLLAVVASGTRCDAVEQLAAEAGIDADVSTMSTIRDRMERIRPRRDFFSARRKAVSEKRMQRLLSAAAAAQETGPRRPHRRRHGCHRRRYHD